MAGLKQTISKQESVLLEIQFCQLPLIVSDMNVIGRKEMQVNITYITIFSAYPTGSQFRANRTVYGCTAGRIR